MSQKTEKNITNFPKRKWSVNIGVVLFGAIFVYLIIIIWLYLTGKHISVYEVRAGSIIKDYAYTGFIVRDEEIIRSKEAGYINFLPHESSKVGALTEVYSVSADKIVFHDSDPAEKNQKLSAQERDNLSLRTASFIDNYSNERFSDVYSLKESLVSVLESNLSDNRQMQLEEMISSGVSDLKLFPAGSDGIISYTIDGYEDISTDTYTRDMVEKNNYAPVRKNDNTKVATDEAIFKIIRSDDWQIIIPLDKENAKTLKDTERIRVRFNKDREIVSADLSIDIKEGNYYGILCFNSSMVRYCKDRYVDLELILEDEEGLKIPKSAVIEKKCYTVEKSFICEGGNSTASGVMIKKANGELVFSNIGLYYDDIIEGTESKRIVYLDETVYPQGTVIFNPANSEECTLTNAQPVKGVYNINKGYAIFCNVKILAESEEYYIIKENGPYSISDFDHIVLMAKDVNDDDVIF